MATKKPTHPQNVLQEAEQIIYGDREQTYGAPGKNLQAIADKESQIAKERELNKLTNQIIEEQATQLAQLQEDLKNITANLPEDAAALAPESIRETIRRLRNIK